MGKHQQAGAKQTRRRERSSERQDARNEKGGLLVDQDVDGEGTMITNVQTIETGRGVYSLPA